MNFNHLDYLPYIILSLIIFITLVFFLELKFFKTVKTYWFFNRSIFSWISSSLFVLGMAGLLLSLLDLRGPEEKIKSEMPTDRTIILIDTSASMLAEDVKPSRLQKAALVAKHFARKAAGHQISVVAFAEVQKKIVPFTNDLDLIDARLDSLKNLRNHYGSSALSLAIQESIQYFKEISGEARGNILVLTDGEETAEGVGLNIPKEVHLALVAIGTEQGGRIPLDDSQGFRLGYKKDRGQDIITKLNENFFKSTAKKIATAKYWLTNSYSLPSDEILDFFTKQKTKGNGEQEMVVKPVLVHWMIIPSVLLLLLASIFKSIRIFSLGIVLVIFPVYARPEPEMSDELVAKISELRSGQLDKAEKVKLADDLYRAGKKNEAIELYSENLGELSINKDVPFEGYLNYGTTLLEKGEVQKGLDVYQNVIGSLKNPEELKRAKEIVYKNTASYFRKKQEEKKKQDKNKDQQNKDQQDQDKKNQDESKSEGNKQDNNKQGKGKGSEDKNKSEQDKKQKDKEEDDGENNKNDKKKDEEKDKESKSEKSKPLPPKKIPAKLKQLMSDDRQLQMKMIENGTKDLNRRKSRQNKDW